jgi:plasmid stabilization system protein ParE
MAFRVVWSPRAVEDLEAIAEYISADSTAYAAAVVKTILNLIDNHPVDPRNAYLSFIRFHVGDKNYVVRFWAPCT